jgi:hypothetical protein
LTGTPASSRLGASHVGGSARLTTESKSGILGLLVIEVRFAAVAEHQVGERLRVLLVEVEVLVFARRGRW